MSLRIQTFTGGPIATNAYLVINEQGDALVIDAPQNITESILAAVEERKATVRLVVITHPHWDHIGDAALLKERTGAPLAAHRLAQERLANPGSTLKELPEPIPPVTPDRFLDEGETVSLGDHEFHVFHLPGHEPSHIALYSESDHVLLSGDILFVGGHGRTDIPGSDPETMRQTLVRVAKLPTNTTAYPGHGKPTTIGAESWLQNIDIQTV